MKKTTINSYFHSCINELLMIPLEIYKSSDEELDARNISLDVSKASDKVRHDCITFKLAQNGISGSLLSLLHDFLEEKYKACIP